MSDRRPKRSDREGGGPVPSTSSVSASDESLIDRLTAAFVASLERNRGGLHTDNTLVIRGGADPAVSAANGSKTRKWAERSDTMVVPEGVVIEGSLNAESDAEISGQVRGNVRVERRLRLGPAGAVHGDMRCRYGQVEGRIEGRTECVKSLDLGPTGVLKSEVICGGGAVLAGEVSGDLKCGGTLRLTSTAVVNGAVRARAFAMEDGAVFNGLCTTHQPKDDTSSGKA